MLKEGARIEGQLATYKITGELGAGGRGNAFTAIVEVPREGPNSARSLAAGTPVVVKVPPSLGENFSFESQREFLSRVNDGLRREFRLFGRLDSVRNAAQVLDSATTSVSVGGSPELCFVLISEYVQGIRLDVWRSQHASRLEDAQFFFLWARRLAQALDSVHRAGIVHGDVHAKNIIIREDEPVLIDFGASVIRAAASTTSQIDDGSHPYLAPERVSSVQADVYSLCGTLYYLVTGEHPPRPDSESKVRAQVVAGLKEHARPLYEQCSGIGNLIARGLRPLARGPRRTPDVQRVLSDIDLFDPRTGDAARDLPALLASIGGLAPRLQQQEPIFARMVVGSQKDRTPVSQNLSPVVPS